jgi:FkbM family methyltransferase
MTMITGLSKRTLLTFAALLVAVAFGSGLAGAQLGKQYERNRACCQVPLGRNILLTVKESLGIVKFPSQIGQDKWVSETVFPGLTTGFFVDVGSADGTELSNTKALEEKGWTGICIDPFPRNMQDRTCQMFKEVVFSEAGRRVTFQAASDVGGIADTLGAWKDLAMKAKGVEFTTTTLEDILVRARAPQFIHFVSLDIEGAELEALKAFPFNRYKIGALAVEHNYEEPKRTEIEALMKRHGYRRSHTWLQDDFYVPVTK